MPLQQILPTWTALNNANFTSPTGIVDSRTGQPFAAGGLNLGDYFDVTNQEAFQASDTANGILYAGRYRLIHVDSGATAANVQTGTVGYMRAGSTVSGIIALTQGISQAAGTYLVPSTGGGGSGAVIQVVVGPGGTLAGAPTVVNKGFGFTSVPTFTLTGTGGTAATFLAQLDSTPNEVTSSEVTSAVGGRAVVFVNPITPGNYGFVQELGTATMLTSGTVAANQFVNVTAASGTVAGSATFGVTTIGVPIDTTTATVANIKVQLKYVPVVQD